MPETASRPYRNSLTARRVMRSIGVPLLGRPLAFPAILHPLVHDPREGVLTFSHPSCARFSRLRNRKGKASARRDRRFDSFARSATRKAKTDGIANSESNCKSKGEKLQFKDAADCSGISYFYK